MPEGRDSGQETAVVDETGKPYANSTNIPWLLQEGVQFSIREGESKRKIDIMVAPDERDILADLLLQMLKYDPQSRASVDSILVHPWFKL